MLGVDAEQWSFNSRGFKNRLEMFRIQKHAPEPILRLGQDFQEVIPDDFVDIEINDV